MGYHALLHRVRLMLQHADHVGGTVIEERVLIPSRLLETAYINRSKGSRSIDADLIGTKADDRPVLLVSLIYGTSTRCTTSLDRQP